VLLQAGPERGGVARHALDQTHVGRAVEQQQLRVFDGVDEVGRGGVVLQAVGIGEPPRFRRELHDVLFALGVDDVVAEAAGGHERGVLCDIAGSLQELTGAEPPVQKRGPDDGEIFGAERRPGFEVRAKDVERRRGNRLRDGLAGHEGLRKLQHGLQR